VRRIVVHSMVSGLVSFVVCVSTVAGAPQRATKLTNALLHGTNMYFDILFPLMSWALVF
jgi:hypothetical protein